MAQILKQVTFDPARCRAEIEEYGALLNAHAELSEKNDILPFFRGREQLSAFVGSYMRNIGSATDLCFEYQFHNDFAADLIVGVKSRGRYCVIEFEDGRIESIFKVGKTKTTSEWSRRFEHGFSQIVDWFSLLDDLKKTERFKKDFGSGHIRFSAMLIIGRDSGVSPYDRYRLDWRTDKVTIDSHPVECVTFDELYRHLDQHLKLNTGF